MPEPVSPWRPIQTKRFMIGVAHYPEHEPRAQIEADAELMADAGINVVRMGEFAWSLFEPEEGRFDFDLFDEAIAALGRRGIDTIMCTPTATPPRWLTARHPDILRVDENGRSMRHGSRQHADLTHPVFRAHSRAITKAMADHYAGNPHVIGWQTDNELNTHFSQTHSVAAQDAFREWLRDRYDDIAHLNDAWGTRFWNRQYQSFEQVETPMPHAPAAPDPSHVLDYRRFLAQATAAFQRDQITILRAVDPDWFVFHNIGYLRDIDLRGDFGRDLDFIGQDVYPFLSDELLRLGPAYCQALQLDQVRGWAGNFIVPEQQTGFGGQPHFATAAPEPGEMRRMAMSSIARGADGLIFFRWRTARYGAESYWMGVLDHDGRPRRRFAELKALSAELKTLAPSILGTSVHVDVAIASCDHDNALAHASYPMGLPDPVEASIPLHSTCYARNIACGFVSPSDDLSRVKLLFLPHLVVWDADWTEPLRRFVEDGGIAIVGCRTATRAANNHVSTATPPGPLAALCGLTVEEYGRLPAPGASGLIAGGALGGDRAVAPSRTAQSAKRVQRLAIGDVTVDAAHWYEELAPDDGTDVLARWTERALAGRPAITSRSLGRGQMVYVGTYLTPGIVGLLLDPLLDATGIRPLVDHPTGIEAAMRTSSAGRLLMLQNTQDQEQIAVINGRPIVVGPRDCLRVTI